MITLIPRAITLENISGKEDEAQAQRIHQRRRQAAQGTFQSPHPCCKAFEADETVRGLVETKGPQPWNWFGTPALTCRPYRGIGFKAHPHMLRHACGFALADKGHDTRALQAYLGHKNIQHTVRYTELSPDRFKDFWR
jgi:hypothetical protein